MHQPVANANAYSGGADGGSDARHADSSEPDADTETDGDTHANGNSYADRHSFPDADADLHVCGVRLVTGRDGCRP